MGTQTDKDIDNLNEQERKFCDAYTAIGKPTCANATKSAIKADYSVKSAHTCGWRLLRRPAIKQRIAEIRGMNSDKILSDLEHTRLLAIEKGDYACAARCSELQGKTLALFVERTAMMNDQEEKGERSEAERRLAKKLSDIYMQQLLARPDDSPQDKPDD